MTVFGFSITRAKAAIATATQGLQSLRTSGWWPLIRESFAGAWQRNVVIDVQDVLSCGPVWACVTLIASDIAKVALNLTQRNGDGIWEPIENSAYSPVLRKPNDYQNRITFIQSWLISKLTRGNTYALKARDASQKVRALYVLDPTRVQVLIAPDGAVYYQLSQDQLSGVQEATVVVPASEIIHDIMIPLYHPLVGVAPIYACGLAATLCLKIQRNSATFFQNQSTPSGILTAPGVISEDTAKRLEDHWNENYAGEQNAGKIAALGDGLKFEPMTTTARDSQLTEQLKDAAIEVCNAYHVPPYMVGYGPPPNYNNIGALNAQYYAQCLQILIESLELCLDEGLDLAANLGVEFDLEGLLRMDAATKMTVTTSGIKGGVYAPNEGRRRHNLKPLQGGDTVFLQEQDHSLEWLLRRDAMPIEAPNTPPTETAAGDTKSLMSGDYTNAALEMFDEELAA
jgi:HK97 family phage portal protein